VFTARYELIPYIKQITFRLLKVKPSDTVRDMNSAVAAALLSEMITHCQKYRGANKPAALVRDSCSKIVIRTQRAVSDRSALCLSVGGREASLCADRLHGAPII
jgi:hypothetical protein